MPESRPIDELPASAFIAAMESLRLSDNDHSMLRVNYSAPNSTLTATQMARQLGYSKYGAANLHYGKLGNRIATELGVQLDNGVLALVTMDWPYGECEWTMRPQIREAITDMGIVTPVADWAASTETSHEPHLVLEGTAYSVTVNAYERNSAARRTCIAHHGPQCAVCNFSFQNAYGNVAADFIHVHHLKALAEIGREYMLDPVADLRPVCPNCHAVIHLRQPPYSIEEVQAFLNNPG